MFQIGHDVVAPMAAASAVVGVVKCGLLSLSPSVDLAARLLDHQRIILLCVNYMFFSVVVTLFLLMLICLSQMSSVTVDTCSSIGLLIVSFILMDLILANYVVKILNLDSEWRVQYV